MLDYKFISQEEMELITSQVLKKSQISYSWNGQIDRIDIDYIIEFVYDLEILWEDIDSLDTSGSVLAAIKPADKLIIMNESKKGLFKEKRFCYIS